MDEFLAIIKTAFKNKVVLFIFSRYSTYIIQFVNSLFIAVYLGPFYLGVWGFISLIIQYLSQTNFGITHSVTAIISIHKSKEFYVQKVIGTSIIMLVALSILAVLFFVANEYFNFNIGEKYNFSTYAPMVVLIGVLGYFNALLSSISRVYGQLFEIAFQQTSLPVLMAIAIIFFKNEDLLWALVGANFLAYLVALILFLIKSPVKIMPIFSFQLFKTIQIKGWHLFVFNTSFIFIIISTRSFVSAYYTVEEFGYFTFAFSLANVINLLLLSFSYLMTPKILNRFATASNEKNVEMLDKVRDAYITTSHVLVHTAILIFPLFIMFFPKYSSASGAFMLISLTIVLYTSSFGYSGLLIAKGFEKKLGYLTFMALVINIISAVILIEVFHVPFTHVIIATLITYILYVFLMGRMGRISLQLRVKFVDILKDIFPVRLFIPYFLSFGLIILDASNIYFIIPLVLVLLLNYRAILNIKSILKTIINNPNFINI